MSINNTQPAAESPFYPVDIDRFIVGNEAALAFFDLYPVSRGHALVIPKKVVSSLFALPAEQLAASWRLVAEVRRILIDSFAPDGFNVGINEGTAAGQTVPHAHIHIIPRYRDDVADPRGGIRWVLPEKVDYWSEMKRETP